MSYPPLSDRFMLKSAPQKRECLLITIPPTKNLRIASFSNLLLKVIFVSDANQKREDSSREPAKEREQENQQHCPATFVKDGQRREDQAQQIPDNHYKNIV